MSEKPLPFVVNDRRKFNAEGDPRPDAPPSEKHIRPETLLTETPEPAAAAPAGSPRTPEAPAGTPHLVPDEAQASPTEDPNLPPPPTAEQMEQARLAYTATADRLDVAIRSANPGMDHPPPMSFDQLVQSVYMQAILLLGGGAQQGEQPQVDILGARQSIDMLAVLAEKTPGNLSPAEQNLLDSALFELRLAFLEITQALSRAAQARAQQGPPPGGPGGPGAPPTPGGSPGFGGPGRPGPSIVR